ncbi:ABC transporter ATP-binding protein [Salinibacterium sp. SWN248]|uniref:ABC transporter ATP-binding protein n=1 Tax=Salinibacterium sp. SWN248 TaxID=2792056 RepID=UPI0018CE44CD|nr:ABC transporter ATP-binding protein [Salinibacterium sp. SWN248]MBH0023558.1 ABC transporter ATP-binding protein [Salinibacterium sp. SWN248]
MRLILKTLRELVPLLPDRAQRFLWGYIVASTSLAILDIAALGLLAISLSSMVANLPVQLPLIGAVPTESYVWIVLTVSLLIITKSILSISLQWVATRRFASYELEIGDKLFNAYIRAPWSDRLKRSTAQLVRLADVGIANTISSFLLPAMTMPTLVITAVSIFAVLVIAQPATALITVVYLGGMAVLLAAVVSRKSVQAGRANRDYSFAVATLMTDMVSALKEITLRNKASEVAEVVHSNRIHTTRARANINFLSAVPKFVLDAALIGGFLLVGGFAYIGGGLPDALAAVAIFGVAGFRLVPALTGFQSVLTVTHASSPHVQAVIDDIYQSRVYIERAETIGHDPIGESPRSLELENVSFTYDGSTLPAIDEVNLTIPMGSTLGLVGSSGAGKSTLVDILLGLLVPSDGSIELDGEPLENVLASWRARVGYVPQDVAIFEGSIAQNVALVWNTAFDPERVESALRRAQLWTTVESRPDGMNSPVGERGMSLSGGQRQRLGIARALYADPLILVLDEATSALDTKTESDVAAAIRSLRGEITIVSVAHRLSTIRDNDQVCFMRDGRIVAVGSFDELVAQVPEFAEQAALAGIS